MSKWVLRVVSSQLSYCCVDTLRESSPSTLVYHFFLSGFQHTWHATPTLWSPSSFSTFMTCRWNIIGAFLFPCNSLSNCQCRPHSSSLSILDHVEWFLAVDAGVEKRHVNVVQTADFCSSSILNCSVLAQYQSERHSFQWWCTSKRVIPAVCHSLLCCQTAAHNPRSTLQLVLINPSVLQALLPCFTRTDSVPHFGSRHGISFALSSSFNRDWVQHGSVHCTDGPASTIRKNGKRERWGKMQRKRKKEKTLKN